MSGGEDNWNDDWADLWDAPDDPPSPPSQDFSEWDGPASTSSLKYFRFELNEPSDVRVLTPFYQYEQHWSPVMCRSPGPGVDPMMDAGHSPKPRFACYVLDKNEPGFFLMDCPSSLRSQMMALAGQVGEVPAGLEAPWFRVVKARAPGAPPMSTRYQCVMLNQERLPEAIAQVTDELWAHVQERRKPHTTEEILDLMEEKGVLPPPVVHPLSAPVQSPSGTWVNQVPDPSGADFPDSFSPLSAPPPVPPRKKEEEEDRWDLI
jgi:hypothetical protein